VKLNTIMRSWLVQHYR